jgi:hypothetical protein
MKPTIGDFLQYIRQVGGDSAAFIAQLTPAVLLKHELLQHLSKFHF